MRISELKNVSIVGKSKDRKITCCYCDERVSRSLLPHVRKSHPEEWERWRRAILDAHNSGSNAKKIMKEEFTIDSRPLFTWSVIEREIRKMIEEGKYVTPNIKKEIKLWEPKEFSLERTTVWKFRNRGDWGPHSGNYRGNWPPQIPRNLILQYSKEGEKVLDAFMGSGTTIVECRLLGRDAIGIDVNPYAKQIADANLALIDREARRQGKELPDSSIETYVLDARDLHQIGSNSIDLICSHPPYFNTLHYTEAIEADLSGINQVDKFLDAMEMVAAELLRILKPGKMCAILMGDFRKKKRLFPLGWKVETVFEKVGFELDDTIIKEQFNDGSMSFYLDHDSRITTHEYLFIFRKPNSDN